MVGIFTFLECFECSSPATVAHHVVPRSLGGIKTIPLCKVCDDKVHSPSSTISKNALMRAASRRKQRVTTFEICKQMDELNHLPIRTTAKIIGIDRDLVYRFRRKEGYVVKQYFQLKNLFAIPPV